MRGLLNRGWNNLVMGSRRPDGAASRPEHVLSFWFGRPPGPRFGIVDGLWLPTRIPCWGGHWATRAFDVDEIIRRNFGELHARAAAGELDDWVADPDGRLAVVILLDQMSRNMYRGTPDAFANDGKVLPMVEEALDRGEDHLFNPLARTLLYLPLMHHERPELIDRCVGLYEAAYAEATGLVRLVLRVELASARRHAEIVHKFGRFPHRNEILGRESTAQERAFLTERFSRF